MNKFTLAVAILVCAGLSGMTVRAEESLAGGKGAGGLGVGGQQGKHCQGGERFAKWDTNGDGKISFEEFNAGAEARAAKREAEGKGNGKGAPDEQKLRARFDKIDTDKDGFLSKAEIMAAVKNCKGHSKHGRSGAGSKAGHSV